MTINHRQAPFVGAAFQHLYCRSVKSTRCVEAHTSNVGDLFAAAGPIKASPRQKLGYALGQGAVGNATKGIAGFSESSAQAAQICSFSSTLTPLGKAERSFLNVVERLIERGYEGSYRRPDALFEGILAATQSLKQGFPI